MKKTLNYLTTQVKNRLSDSMFIYANNKYQQYRNKYLKIILPNIVGAGISTLALIPVFMNSFPRTLESLIFALFFSSLLICCACVGAFSTELLTFKNKHKEFKNIDLTNEKFIVERFNELFYNKNFEENQSKFHQYNWDDFDLKLTSEEIKYLMEISFNNEQLEYLKETIFEKKELSFTTLKKLEHLGNERALAIEAAFKNFLISNKHKQLAVARKHEANTEIELEVAYNRYI